VIGGGRASTRSAGDGTGGLARDAPALEKGGLKIDLQVEGTERLMSLARQQLYQIAQEALNNALKQHTCVESSPGKGTTIHVSAPTDQAASR
jgi:signal transduction histidine kinase